MVDGMMMVVVVVGWMVKKRLKDIRGGGRGGGGGRRRSRRGREGSPGTEKGRKKKTFAANFSLSLLIQPHNASPKGI